MNKNVGTIDRVLRVVFAVVVAVLLLTGTVTGTLAVVLGALAAVFLLTGAVSFCPLYALLHLHTRTTSSN